jgi:heme oxygenase
MTDVLKRVEQNRKRIAPRLREDLTKKPLSRLLRRESWPDHERAQYHPFEMALAMGTITREGYADLLSQVYPVYLALEKRESELLSDPIAGRVVFPELHRSAGVAADLDYYWPAWREESRLLPGTVEYVARIQNANPIQFVAHHYNRYLADLSGGLMIAAALKRAWKLDGEGLKYYDFPEISSADEWKNGYREILDDLPLSIDEKMALIEEVMVAYEYNIEMAEVLGAHHLEPAGA